MLKYIDILNNWRRAMKHDSHAKDNVKYEALIKSGVEYLRRDLKRGYCI